jgi:hypothetical protein
MTRLDDVVTDIADLLGPPLEDLVGAAREMAYRHSSALTAPPPEGRSPSYGPIS